MASIAVMVAKETSSVAHIVKPAVIRFLLETLIRVQEIPFIEDCFAVPIEQAHAT